jgi:LmbE family N-acetylglucosaminyl deacetylase
MATLVLSPHFDDAVLSCGHWLERHPGCVIATVCSGRPGTGVPADPKWDALSGFTWADEAAESRCAEDRNALDILNADQALLGFLDGDYKEMVGRPHEDGGVEGTFEETLAHSIETLLDHLRPVTLLLPLGLQHGDHIATGDAALMCLAEREWCRGYGYVDLPYAITTSQSVDQRVGELRARGFQFASYYTKTASPQNAKGAAVYCYSSQVPELLGRAHPLWERSLDLDAETFFRLLR